MRIKLERIEKKGKELTREELLELVDTLLERVNDLEASNRHLLCALSAYMGMPDCECCECEEDDECDGCECDICDGCPLCECGDDEETDEANERAFDREMLKAQVAETMEKGAEKAKAVMDKAAAAVSEFAKSEEGQKLKAEAKKVSDKVVDVSKRLYDKVCETVGKTDETSTDNDKKDNG